MWWLYSVFVMSCWFWCTYSSPLRACISFAALLLSLHLDKVHASTIVRICGVIFLAGCSLFKSEFVQNIDLFIFLFIQRFLFFYSFRDDILPNKICHAAGVSWWYPLHFSGEFIWTFRVCGCSSLTNRPLLLSKCTNGNTVGIKYCQLISPECGVSAPWGDIHYGRSIIDEGEYMCNNS